MPPPDTPPALEVQGLAKRYGARQAVADVSLRVAPGELLGLLGPNGAGKSTTIAMVCGLTPPDAGRVRIGGQDLASEPVACRRRLGLVTQDLALIEELPARRNVALFGALYGLKGPALQARADAVLAQVGLQDRAGDLPSSFSGGMKRRLHIACALVHDPQVLLLDEPTAGVDPQSRHAIFETLAALKAQGKALVYTTHYMEEVERLADRIVIVDHGRVVAEGTLAELTRRLPGAQRLSLALQPTDGGAAGDRGSTAARGDGDTGGEVAALLRTLPAVRGVESAGGRWLLATDDLTRTLAALGPLLQARGLQLDELASGRATLEDVFLSLTGRALRDH
ncbi:ABC transporter ATP-binding protein [Piscinibacter sakaiensis]|uniref:ABC transporter, ATP-binding protein n=1 Tax=Piscinibacter sakaiensis TaxID=1547922 RepID=A0A0K8NYJ5_PISS1|nr:ABC transporter ATP-binding protein [Piscinibacter sakaiensis]GAP35369.1 ABC transporter, ATP-binding protein [Piscinibacter sakaiensis]